MYCSPAEPSFCANNRILVTGASSGIGGSISLLMNRLGATVIASGRNIETLCALKNQCAEPEHFITSPQNLIEDMEALPEWLSNLAKTYGKLSGMVCSAGITEPMPLRLFDLAEAKKIFDVNYFAPMLLAKGFCDRRNNIGKGAAIVFLGSLAATTPLRSQVSYAGSKAALIMSARGISLETAKQGIRVNSVSPAEVVTPLFYRFNETLGDTNPEKSAESRYPLGLGSPKDIAPLVAFLLSENARWITGQNYIVDGGFHECNVSW